MNRDDLEKLSIYFIIHNTGINECSVSEDDVKSILIDKYIPRKMPLKDVLEILRHKKVFRYIISHCDGEITVKDILTINRMLLHEEDIDPDQIPEEKKMELANQKRSENAYEDDSLDKQPAPPYPHDKLSLVYLTNLVTAIAKKVNSLSDDMLDLKTAVNLQQSNIANFTEITKNNYHNIEHMEKEMQNFFDVKIATETTQKILEAMKIKWDLTYSPLTQEDVYRQMETSPFKKEYTILNNIINEISQLKMTVENKMEDLQKNPGSPEYQDLYILGQTLERIFNVWPPKLKYFAADKERSIEIQMEEALRIDISAALSEAEAEKQIKEIMK